VPTNVRIRSAADDRGRDAAVAALRNLAAESGQVVVVGISLSAGGPVVQTRNHAGFECSHYFDYPARLAELTAAVQSEDELAVVRSEMCASTLIWMSDHDVPRSEGFEEFLRWAVFAEMAFDDDAVALVGRDSAPVRLPVGWRLQPGRLRGGAEVVRVEVERPHSAEIRDTTWLTIRADGWTSIRIGSGDRPAGHLDVPTPPHFVTIRPSAHAKYLDAWFLNEDVDAVALIDFARDCPRPGDGA